MKYTKRSLKTSFNFETECLRRFSAAINSSFRQAKLASNQIQKHSSTSFGERFYIFVIQAIFRFDFNTSPGKPLLIAV